MSDDIGIVYAFEDVDGVVQTFKFRTYGWGSTICCEDESKILSDDYVLIDKYLGRPVEKRHGKFGLNPDHSFVLRFKGQDVFRIDRMRKHIIKPLLPAVAA